MWLSSFYKWFWMHTEFWVADKVKRRPYTYIFRDWIYTHIPYFVVCLVMWATGLTILSTINPILALWIGLPTSMLLGHLIWGTKWVPNEMSLKKRSWK